MSFDLSKISSQKVKAIPGGEVMNLIVTHQQIYPLNIFILLESESIIPYSTDI